MKFSANRLYVERYLKCANCGVLVYENDKEQLKDEGGTLFCSSWCQDWAKKRTEAQ
ncbi:MAG: hypothetical protein RIC87_05545 [Kiloniellales bacterium]